MLLSIRYILGEISSTHTPFFTSYLCVDLTGRFTPVSLFCFILCFWLLVCASRCVVYMYAFNCRRERLYYSCHPKSSKRAGGGEGKNGSGKPNSPVHISYTWLLSCSLSYNTLHWKASSQHVALGVTTAWKKKNHLLRRWPRCCRPQRGEQTMWSRLNVWKRITGHTCWIQRQMSGSIQKDMVCKYWVGIC